MMLPYRALWRREINGRLSGQNPDVPSTWVRDHLWGAAVLQHRAEETERMLQEVLDYPYPHPETVAHFLAQYEADCAACHAEFLRGEEAARVA